MRRSEASRDRDETTVPGASIRVDVAIIGAGPAGTTTATILKKYNPDLRIAILERERFPRDHIGESLLPPTSPILNEMGCWDKVEAANFPIKLGATYRWGRNPELWDFDFVPVDEFREEPRPAKLEGQRTQTAFQVDRSIYDKVLLDHAAEKGVEVREEAKVSKVRKEGDRVTALQLETGETVCARHYVDASGNSGVLRRAMGIECAYHPHLMNIAIWDYWQNAEWAVSIGVGGTRIQVRSLPYGWIWFIPVGPTRTSIGLVTPVEYYKQSGKRPAELYEQALEDEPTLAALLANASSEGKLTSTKDWSFLAERHTGENWYLAGECAGFADPILSAGVTLAHMAGRQLAYSINEIEQGGDANWIKEQFQLRQRERIDTHIRFGNYWYTANEQLKDLKQFTTTLAAGCGLEMTPEKAWDWIARGGFISEDLTIGIGGFEIGSLKASSPYLADLKYDSPLEKSNVFKLDLRGATSKDRATYARGRVGKTACYVREGRTLPVSGPFELLIWILGQESKLDRICARLNECVQQSRGDPVLMRTVFDRIVPALEAMIADGWVHASCDPNRPLAQFESGFVGFRENRDTRS